MSLFLNDLPVIFFKQKRFDRTDKIFYKIKSTNVFTRRSKYKIFKKFYFILFYSDLILIDRNFLTDLINKKNRVLTYLDKNKNYFICFYYNNKIYGYQTLLTLIKNYNYLYPSFFYFLTLKNNNYNFLKILFYIKKKCQL